MANGEKVGSLYYDLDIDDAKLSEKLGKSEKSVKDYGDKVNDMSEKMQAGLKKAAVGLGVAGTGLTLLSKDATDFTVDLVKNSKSLAREIGVTTAEASRLTAAMQHMGIDADSSQQMFGIFSKQIVAATESAKGNSTAQKALQIQIEQTQAKLDSATGALKQNQAQLSNQMSAVKIAISETTKQINLHGDATGALKNKLEGLQLKLSDLEGQFDDNASSTGKNTLETKALETQLQGLKDQLGATGSAFDKLGISTVDAKGDQKDFNTLLFEVADKFKALPDGVDKTAISMELFGRSGKDMVKVLNLGSSGIKDLEAQADKLGITLTDKTVAGVAAMIASQKRMKEASDSVKIAVGTLTAPVMAALQDKIADLIGSFQSLDEPLKSVIANTVAFSGPVLGAAASVAAFGASLVQMWPAITAAGAAVAGFGIAVGPAILLVVGLTAAVAGVIWVLNQLFGSANNVTTAQQQLEKATRDVAAAKDADKLASDNLIDANLRVEGAALGLERAQKDYNDTLAQYGPQSLEAREANYRLETAQNAVKTAADNAKKAQEDKAAKEKELAKNTDMQVSLQKTTDKANEQKTAFQQLITKMGEYSGSLSQNGVTPIGQAVTNLAHRATGGPVRQGTPYEVGEVGRELFVPNMDGTIIPHNILDSLSRDGGTKVYNGGDINVNIGNIEDRQDADYLLRRIDRDRQVVGLGLSPAGGM